MHWECIAHGSGGAPVRGPRPYREPAAATRRQRRPTRALWMWRIRFCRPSPSRSCTASCSLLSAACASTSLGRKAGSDDFSGIYPAVMFPAALLTLAAEGAVPCPYQRRPCARGSQFDGPIPECTMAVPLHARFRFRLSAVDLPRAHAGSWRA